MEWISLNECLLRGLGLQPGGLCARHLNGDYSTLGSELFRLRVHSVYLSSLPVLFPMILTFVGVFAFGGSYGAVTWEGLALLEGARRIRVLAWVVFEGFW